MIWNGATRGDRAANHRAPTQILPVKGVPGIWGVLLLIAAGSGMNDSPRAQTADPLAELTDRYHRDRRRLITENLALTAAESRAFWPLYEEYERDLTRLTERRRALIAEFGENFDAMSDSMAKKILLNRLKIEEERNRLRRTYLPRFEKVLPIRKLARYYQLESKIRAAVEAGIAEELPLLE
ncbi:hypothetical protein ACW73L_11050 [Methylolobus aquaticus]